MSGTKSANEPPKTWTGLEPGEQRVKSAYLGDVLQAPDTALATPTMVLSRRDLQSMTAADMTVVGSAALDSTNMIVSAVLQGGTVYPVAYWARVGAVGNVTGRPYYRTISISTVWALG